MKGGALGLREGGGEKKKKPLNKSYHRREPK